MKKHKLLWKQRKEPAMMEEGELEVDPFWRERDNRWDEDEDSEEWTEVQVRY